MKDDRGRERGKVREYFLKVSFKYHIQKGAPVITTQNFDKENKLVEPAPRSRNRVRQPGAFLVLLTGTPTGTSKSLDYFAHFGGFMDTGTRGRVFFHGWFCFLSCLSHTLACSAVVNSPTDNTKCQRGCGGPRTLLSCQGRGGAGGGVETGCSHSGKLSGDVYESQADTHGLTRHLRPQIHTRRNRVHLLPQSNMWERSFWQHHLPQPQTQKLAKTGAYSQNGELFSPESLCICLFRKTIYLLCGRVVGSAGTQKINLVSRENEVIE